MSALRDDEEFVGVLAQLAREYVFFVRELRFLLARVDHIVRIMTGWLDRIAVN